MAQGKTEPVDRMLRKGQCLCGATSYHVLGALDEAAICHCTMCRRATGSALNVAVPVTTDRVEWTGREKLTEFESSPGKMRAFCGGCGAAVYSRRTDKPHSIRLRIGLLEQMDEITDLYHIYWASRIGWIDHFDALPKNDGEEPGRD